MRILRKGVFVFILGSIFVFFNVTYRNSEDVKGVTSDTIKIGGMVDMTGPLAGTYRIVPKV
ncbi:MAG: hypothetical protein SVY10_21695 [Thermodesulfobacteriota bacterium]|nr:hypothetical protein [Thermodesulfobacteriota bacterium]